MFLYSLPQVGSDRVSFPEVEQHPQHATDWLRNRQPAWRLKSSRLPSKTRSSASKCPCLRSCTSTPFRVSFTSSKPDRIRLTVYKHPEDTDYIDKNHVVSGRLPVWYALRDAFGCVTGHRRNRMPELILSHRGQLQRPLPGLGHDAQRHRVQLPNVRARVRRRSRLGARPRSPNPSRSTLLGRRPAQVLAEPTGARDGRVRSQGREPPEARVGGAADP